MFCIHGVEGSEVWITTWISESRAHLKSFSKCGQSHMGLSVITDSNAPGL